MKTTVASGLAAVLITACQPHASVSNDLRLVLADDFAVIFVTSPVSASRPTGPVEIERWSFHDKSDALTINWGWDTAWSRIRIDCDAGLLQPVLHRTYREGDMIEEVTPDGPPTRAAGIEDHEMTVDAACNPASEPSTVVFSEASQARAWADRHYQSRERPSP